MGKINIKDLFYDLQNQMIAKHCTNRRGIPHPGTKGDTSELNWIQWLKDYLPKRYCVDPAFIIDCTGDVSDQIDLVIYDQQYTPFVFFQDGVRYIPAESVYAVFEVKQELSKANVEYAGKKALSVRSLRRTSAPIPHAGGFYPPKLHNEIITGILTLSSTWIEPFGKPFEDMIAKSPSNERLNMGCVLQSGSFKIDFCEQVPKLQKSTQEESLMFFFLTLLMDLQKLGTIPAMDIECYATVLDSI